VKVIPDSSFFICFLDDLVDHLRDTDRIRILTAITRGFTVLIVPAVLTEARLDRFPVPVRDQICLTEISETLSDPSIELLRPLLGKGEHEVISCAHEHFLAGDATFLFILDDGVARNLVKRMLPLLTDNMKGTVGFLGFCTSRKVLDKDETIHLITIIGQSNFRVDNSTITAVIAGIQNQCE
jgi:predicted nucleic acid-binding protein